MKIVRAGDLLRGAIRDSMSQALGGELGWAGLGWAADSPLCRQRFNLGALYLLSHLLSC